MTGLGLCNCRLSEGASISSEHAKAHTLPDGAVLSACVCSAVRLATVRGGLKETIRSRFGTGMDLGEITPDKQVPMCEPCASHAEKGGA